MSVVFEPATREAKKIKMVLYGPSGSGKTMSALKIASGLGENIAVGDSEHGSASMYADVVPFQTVKIAAPYSIDNYIEVIEAAEAAEFDVLILDSITHAWKWLLDNVEKHQKGNNSFTGWAWGTPKQNQLIEAILAADMHIICTMRGKTQWDMVEEERNGRTIKTPTKVGVGADQRKDIEYEFDIIGTIDMDHTLHIEKDRTEVYQDAYIEKPGARVGEAYIKWVKSGVEPAEKNVAFKQFCQEQGWEWRDVNAALAKNGHGTIDTVDSRIQNAIRKRPADFQKSIDSLGEEPEADEPEA